MRIYDWRRSWEWLGAVRLVPRFRSGPSSLTLRRPSSPRRGGSSNPIVHFAGSNPRFAMVAACNLRPNRIFVPSGGEGGIAALKGVIPASLWSLRAISDRTEFSFRVAEREGFEPSMGF